MVVELTENERRWALRFSHLWCHWRARDESSPLGGEFYLPAFLEAVVRPGPALAWEETPESERALFSEWRVIDQAPGSGTGALSAVRLQSDVDPLEIWHYERRFGPLRMDVDYLGYLDALLVTKGTYGWQYLFVDTSMRSIEHIHHVRSLTARLDLFPRIFPDHDYAPLRARLTERC